MTKMVKQKGRRKDRTLTTEIARAIKLEPELNVSQFEALTPDAWYQWIDSYLNGQPCLPPIPIGRAEPHHTLLALYEDLGRPEVQERFAEAVARLFETTPALPQNAERLFYLIQMISRLRQPFRAKRMVRRLLYSGSLREMTFGLRDLHLMLAVTASEYDFDDEFSYFLSRSAEQETDLAKLLVYFRLIARDDSRAGWHLLETRILPELRPDGAAMLGRVLRGIVKKVGYRTFLEWYIDSIECCSSRYPDQISLFLRVLMLDVLPNDYRGSDGHLIALLSFTTAMRDQSTDPNVLISLARLKQRLGPPIARALGILWDRGRRSGMEQPWSILLPNEPIVLAQKIANRIAVVSGDLVSWLNPEEPSDRAAASALANQLTEDIEARFGSSLDHDATFASDVEIPENG
jgi:hypothetical protein